MAPTTSINVLAKRYSSCSYNGYGNGYNDYGDCNSSWDNWGRWVALGVIVVAALLLAFLCSCYNTRRRRRRGLSPMYGTGWMPGHKATGNYYNGGAAPPYSPQPQVENQNTGNTFNNNDGYYGNAYNNGYGGQQGGIELQQPQHSYQPRGGEPVYEAPQGPPPGKGDGIIR